MSGPGETQKNHVIDLLCRDVIFFFEQTQQVELADSLVLLTEPTANAAFNKGGVTMHSALQLNL